MTPGLKINGGADAGKFPPEKPANYEEHGSATSVSSVLHTPRDHREFESDRFMSDEQPYETLYAATAADEGLPTVAGSFVDTNGQGRSVGAEWTKTRRPNHASGNATSHC